MNIIIDNFFFSTYVRSYIRLYASSLHYFLKRNNYHSYFSFKINSYCQKQGKILFHVQTPYRKNKQKTIAELHLLNPLREQNAPQLMLFLYHFPHLF